MRLLTFGRDGQLRFTPDLVGRDTIPPYAILSHTWGDEEVTYQDVTNNLDTAQAGYAKIEFCGRQAKLDGLDFFWVDTCCIDKSSSAELQEAINSMFRWYRNAKRCYVYLSDISSTGLGSMDVDLSRSRWFKRGWTLQESLAPAYVQFFTIDGVLLGDKVSLAQVISEFTGIPLRALQEDPLIHFGPEERMSWADGRETKREEDEAYSLLGLLDVQISILYSEGRPNAFRRLRREIRERQAEGDGSSIVGNVHWIVPKAVTGLFVGRSELIQRIENSFCPHGSTNIKKQRRFIITGIGGQGKSEVCLKVANLMREDFWGVFWVDVSDSSTAQSGFTSIARSLNSSAITIEESLLVLARTTRRWLLVLDNADDPKQDYAEYFPPGERGAVLLTSRNPQSQDYSTVGAESLQGLSTQDSTQLLLTAAHIAHDMWSAQKVHADDIVNLLGSHTLAIIQAGAYVAQGYSTLKEYAQRFQEHRKRLLQHHPDQQRSRYRNVYATFEASVDVLIHSHDDAGSDAMDLLATLSMLHWTMVPLQLFHDAWAGARDLARHRRDNAGILRGPAMARPSRSLKNFWKAVKRDKVLVEPETTSIETLGQEHVARLPAFVGAHLEIWDDYRLKRASALLASLGLVTRHISDEANGLSMHPLAHAWAKERFSKDEQQRIWVSTACVCALSRGMSRIWILSKDALRPHIRTLIPPTPSMLFSYGPKDLILPIVIHCGWILNFTWEHRNLDNLLAAIYQTLEITPQHPERSHIPIWRLTATAALHLHHTKLAIFLLEFITNFDRSISNKIQPGEVPTRYNLARAYNDNGQYEKAVLVLEHLIFTFKATSLDQQWILSSRFELNRAYNAIGLSREAVELLREVLRALKSAEGKEAIHDRLRAQHALAIAYIANKQTKDAIKLLEDAVGTYETMLDEAHPDRITAQHELARAYKSDGQSDKSLALLKHIVAIQERTLDKTDYILVASQYTLGTHYLASKDTGLAIKLLEHVVNVYVTILDETQSERLSAQYALALAYVDAKELDKSLALMRHVVEVRQSVLESGHPHRVQSERLLKDLEDGTVYD